MPAIVTLLFTLCILSSTSCDSNHNESLSDNNSQDSELLIHRDTFLTEAAKRNITISQDKLSRLVIAFSDLPPNVLGSCIETADGSVRISISNTLRGAAKWTTLHELGHCLLGILHRNEHLSIMNSTDVSAELDAADSQDLFDELFQDKYFYAF